MAEKVLFQINYVRLLKGEDGILCLEVDDMELWDLVQDYLWDNFHITESEVGFPIDGHHVHRSYYDSIVEPDTLVKALSGLDVNELERIYRLNN